MSLVEPTMLDRFKMLSPRKQVLSIAIALIVLILGTSLLVWTLSGGGKGKKEERLETNIDRGFGQNAVIGNLVTNQQEAVNNAAKNTNNAIRDLANSVNRDSSTFNGNRANSRYCARFPEDSTCRQ